MNRRDTILLAVLINTGLLVVLFITALKPSLKLEEMTTPVIVQEEVRPKNLPTSRSSIDQVDHILSQYVKQEKKEEEKELIQTANNIEEKKLLDNKFLKKDCAEVVVKQGDVLEKIARQHGTTVEEIMQLNQMKSSKLQVGQILQVPVSSSASTAPGMLANMASKIAQDSISKEAKYYTVKGGDNPWTIAVKNHIKVEELLRLNNLDEEKAKKLKPGDQLRIK